MMRLRLLDTAALSGVCLTLLIAFYFQLFRGELPCAFCNLQRVGFMIFGGGLLLNLLQGTSAWNYVLSGVGALIGSLVGLLQMFVHAPAGTPAVGEAFLGLHMYDWSYIILTGAIFYALLSVAVLAARPGNEPETARREPAAAIVAAIFALIVAANVGSAFLQNGFQPFKGGGQRHYQLLYRGDVMKA